MASAAEPSPAGGAAYDAQIRPILAKHCLECHSGEKPKGDLRLDKLPPGFGEPAAGKTWGKVLERIQAGEMPPEEKPRLADAESQQLGDWIAAGLAAAAAERRAREGRVVLRRLNRGGIRKHGPRSAGDRHRPEGPAPPGYRGQRLRQHRRALHVSSFLMDRYLDAADKALNAAIANRPQPPATRRGTTCAQGAWHLKNSTERVFRFPDDELIMFSSSPWNAVILWQFYPSERGRYRFRIPASAFRAAASR